MKNWQIKLSLLLNFLLLAILLNSVGAVALHVQRAYGVSESSAGTLAVFKSLGIVVASSLAALGLVRIGYRRAMLIALGVLTVVCLLVPSVPDFGMIKLLFVVAGISFAMIKVSVYAALGLLFPDRKTHASFMSFLESVFMGGIVSGYFLFSAFTDDAHPESTAWLRVFYVLAAVSAAAWLLLFTTTLDESALADERHQPWRKQLPAAFWPATRNTVPMFAACVFLYVMLEQSTLNWLPTFNTKALHLPAHLGIQFASLLTVAMVLGRFGAGLVLQRVSWFPVLAVCLLASAGLVLLSLSLAARAPTASVVSWREAPAAAFVFPLIGIFVGPIYPVINSAILNAVPVAWHGTVSSLGVIFSACGSASGTVLLGYLLEVSGGHAAFYFTLLPITGLLLCLYFFNRRTRAAAT